MTGLLERGLCVLFTWNATVDALAMTGLLDRGLSGEAVLLPGVGFSPLPPEARELEDREGRKALVN